jgi:glycogen synthase kinase 3 beta
MTTHQTPDLEIHGLLGSGSFGYVFEAYDKNRECKVALKRTTKAGDFVSREYEVLELLKGCKNCIQVLDIFYSKNEDEKLAQNLVFEFCSDNLESMITEVKSRKDNFSIEKVRDYARQVLTGLKEIHERNIVHRDLKPENVLVTEEGEIKICDFGSSKILDPNGKNTPYIVSRYYRAPELILGVSNYSEKIDIWATGCIIVELLMLKPLFPGKTEGSQFLEQMAILGTPSSSEFERMASNIPKTTMKMLKQLEKFERKDLGTLIPSYYRKRDIKKVVSLIEAMLEWDPKDRITAEEALQHEFFTSAAEEED